MEMKTWRDIEKAALFDPVLHAAVTMAERGDCTREEALIYAVLHYANESAQRYNEELQRLMGGNVAFGLKTRQTATEPPS